MRKTKSKKIFIFFSFLFIAAMVFYIFQINSLTTTAYASTTLQKQLKQAEIDHFAIQTNLAKNFSLAQVSTMAAQLNFERVDTVSYVQVIAGSVAAR